MDDNIEVVPSEDNGNVPAESPSEQPKAEAPAEKVETAQPAEPVQELYELPDKRMVDAATLAKEFKENFLPEFTRKSQELAKLKEGTLPDNKPAEDPYADPNYAPQTYAEIIQAAKQAALNEISQREQERVQREQALESEVVNQLSELKKLDPTLNENTLFSHALKYGFKDLRVAHQNMKDMSDLAKTVQKQTAQNIAKRADPVSVSPGATGQRPDPGSFSNSVEYLRALKGTG